MSLKQEMGPWDYTTIAEADIKLQRLRYLAKRIFSPACVVTEKELAEADKEYCYLLWQLLSMQQEG